MEIIRFQSPGGGIVPGDLPRQERIPFSGTVRSLEERDLILVRPILEAWVRSINTGNPLTTLIDKYLVAMQSSVSGENEDAYFVAEEHEEVLGVVGMSYPPNPNLLRFTHTDRPVELKRLYVDPAHRQGRGIGSALVDRVRQVSREKGFTEIVLDSGPRYSESGWPFHDRQFQRAGVARHQYGLGFHAQVWNEVLV